MLAEYIRPPLVVVCSPSRDLLGKLTESNCSRYLFREPPADIERFCMQHLELVLILQRMGIQVIDIANLRCPELANGWMAACPNMFYARDSGICLPEGGVVLRMATKEREHEPRIMEHVYNVLDIPIIARAPVDAVIEGGDIIFLDNQTLLVGYGPRTSLSGVRFIRDVVQRAGNPECDVIAIPISPERINLDGVLIPLSHSLIMADTSAVVGDVTLYQGGAEFVIGLRDLLRERRIDLLEITRQEGYMLATNVVHIGDRRVIAYEHTTDSNARLEAAGYIVHPLPGDELIKGAGGPRCMTNIIRFESVPPIRGCSDNT